MALDSSTVRLLSQLAEGDGKPLHECSPDEARSKDVGYQIHSNPIGFQYIRASCPDKTSKLHIDYKPVTSLPGLRIPFVS